MPNITLASTNAAVDYIKALPDQCRFQLADAIVAASGIKKMTATVHTTDLDAVRRVAVDLLHGDDDSLIDALAARVTNPDPDTLAGLLFLADYLLPDPDDHLGWLVSPACAADFAKYFAYRFATIRYNS